MILRYFLKFTLQHCAVLSQLSMHKEALQKSKEAAKFWQKVLLLTQRLCKKRILKLSKKEHGNSSCKNLKHDVTRKSKSKIINSEYGSVLSANQQSSNSSKCYGISPAAKKFDPLKIKFKPRLKTKLVFLEKDNLENLENVWSPRNRSEEKSTLSDNFMKKRSSTQSEDYKRNRDRSESSVSSTRSVVRLTKAASIEGLHTFNLKRVANSDKDGSDCSFDSKSNLSHANKHNKSLSRALYVEEKVQVKDKTLAKTHGKQN